MIYHVRHRTTYLYSEPVSLCHNLVHLAPRKAARQACLKTRLHIDPAPAVSHDGVDYFGNPVTSFTVQEAHEELEVSAEHLVDVRPYEPPDAAVTPPWEEVARSLREDRTRAGLEAGEFLYDSPYVATNPDLREYALGSFLPGRPWLEAVLDLTARIHREFRYDSKATTVATPLSEAFAARRGVCQDFAHVQIGSLRSIGLPARYVSGYLLTTPPPGRPRLVGADASHAWVSAYCPGLGWVDADPTNNLVPSDKHVLLAWGRDYDDVCPIKGVILGGGEHTVKVAVDVAPATGEGVMMF